MIKPMLEACQARKLTLSATGRHRVVMATKKKPKQRRKPDEERREISIRVLVTEDEDRAFKSAAKRAGLTVSSWLRSLGIREAGKV